MPVNSLDAYDTREAFKQICGTKSVMTCYSDRHESLAAAAKWFDFLWRTPPPGDSQSNGVIEALNRRLQEGARTCLSQAGLPICWWSFAVEHVCFLRNTAEDPAGTSPYQRTRGDMPGARFNGLRVPFGVGVFYYPNDTKYKHQHKFQSRLSYGIIVGYGMEPGQEWDGTYKVIDLDFFVNKSLDDFADPVAFGHPKDINPHETKVIKLEAKGYRFPLAEKYWRANTTLAGREEYYNDTTPVKDELHELNYSVKAECNRLMRAREGVSQEEFDEILHDLSSHEVTSAESASQTAITSVNRDGKGGESHHVTLGGDQKIQMANITGLKRLRLVFTGLRNHPERPRGAMTILTLNYLE